MARPRERQPTDTEKRLQAICEDQGFETIEELAESVGVPAATLRKAGQRDSLSKEVVKALADRFGLSAGWLLTGQNGLKTGTEIAPPPPPSAQPTSLPAGIVKIDGQEFVSIKRYDAALSAGPGSINDPSAEPLGYHLIEAQWLRALTSSLADDLAVLRVDGDSMEPTLYDGDWVLVDRAQIRIGRPGVYALAVGDLTWVKRLTLNLSSKRVQVISDNHAYPLQELEEDDLSVRGRVVWVVGRKL